MDAMIILLGPCAAGLIGIYVLCRRQERNQVRRS